MITRRTLKKQFLTLSCLLLTCGLIQTKADASKWGGHFSYQPLLENNGEALRLPIEAWPAHLKIRNQNGQILDVQAFLDLPVPDYYTKEVQVYRLSDQISPIYLVIPSRALFADTFYLPTLQSQGKIINPLPVDSEPAEPLQELYQVKQIMDLTGDGLADVIYESNSGASSYQTTQHILWWDGKHYRSQILFQFLKLYDFEQDGKIELKLSMPAAFDEATSVGHANWTYWDDIYRWNGHKFILASKNYPDYYLKVALPQYQAEIEALRKDGFDPETETAIRARKKAILSLQKLIKKR